ncbi:molybdopterin binding domain protein [Dictyocaulus viviparus]|uniref:Molybdopterin binding domain protein n=1 Tax=Dictyocaulus viviparus TaxID=29172 RepID=A0A0D8Y659_DICVI|nr:molybdopterin binding domain protein [Dictyocaulus viviparus]
MAEVTMMVHMENENTKESVINRSRQSTWPALPVEEVFAMLEKVVIPTCVKYIPITSVRVGQVLAERIVAHFDVPEVRTSVKDGYAVLSADSVSCRKVIGCSTAGSPFLGTVSTGECVRISTGAPVPNGADAVVMVENTRLIEHDGDEELIITIDSVVIPGQDIRKPGSDISKGDLLLDCGCLLGSAEIGILAGTGRRSVLIYRRPKVCVLSTGNEASRLFCSLAECTAEEVPFGHIRDTNRPQLIALFSSMGFKAIDAGIAADKRECLAEAISVSFRYAHVLVTSGGVSMGEKDLMKNVLMNDFGFEVHFGRVWMKPGLPTTFATGVIDGERKFVFALPGNPVSSWVTAQLFAIPLLRKAAGHVKIFQHQIKVVLAEDIILDIRPEYRRAWLQHGCNIPLAFTTGNQSSSRLMSLSGANVLLKLPSRSSDRTTLKAGDIVDALWLGSF